MSALREVATQESIEYALDRAAAVERKFPLLSLVYRVVAEVLQDERDRAEGISTPRRPRDAA